MPLSVQYKLPLFSLIALAIALPYMVTLPIVCTALFYLSAIALYLKERKRNRTLFVLMLWSVVYVSLNALSTLWSPHVWVGLSYLDRYLTLLLFPLFLWLTPLEKGDLRKLMRWLFIGAAVFVLLSLCCMLSESYRLSIPLADFFQLKKSLVNDEQCFRIVYRWFSRVNPTYNIIVPIAGLLCGVYCAKGALVRWWHVVLYALLLLVLIIVTQTRIGAVMYGISIGCTIFYLLYKNKRALMAFILLVIAVGGVGLKMGLVERFIDDPVRKPFFFLTLNSIKERPLLGYGLSGVKEEFRRVGAINDDGTYYDYFSQPNNQFLSDWMQTGITGLLLLLFLLGYLLVTGVKNRNFLLLSFTVCIIFLMTIEASLFFVVGNVPIIIILSLFLALNGHRRSNHLG